MTKIVAVIQARMNSSRLPGKMMLDLKGAPVIEWVYRRVGGARMVDDIIVAVPETPEDKILKEFLEGLGAGVFTGSEKDVLGRFYGAARERGATHVIRVCADNPFISPEEIDALVQFYLSHACDYAYNHIPKGNRYADGLGAEMVAMEVLERIHQRASLPEEREHIFNYVWNHADEFKMATFDPANEKVARPELRLDLDTQDDYDRYRGLPVDIEMPSEKIIELIEGAA